MQDLTTYDPAQSHWVFGYGSLIWRPGFSYLSAHKARLRGAHRSLCIYSHHYRGTPEQPGLVFGLLRGGSCNGMAFEVAPEDWKEVLAYLRERELVSGVYREAHRKVALMDGRAVTCLAYLVDEKHAQYAGRLTLEEQVRVVLAGHGSAGPNADYVLNTAQHLTELGIRDRHLHLMAERLAPSTQ